MSTTIATPLDADVLGTDTTISARSIDRFARAHDASHYLLIPDAVLEPRDAGGVARAFAAVRAAGRTLTFRSGGTSLSGQGVSGDVLVDTRQFFRGIRIEDDGRLVRVEPGATVRQVNTRLLRHGRKLGPDPASEIACTIGGVIANNSSGMACGVVENSYRTVDSLLLVLPSGTVIDTGAPDALEQLQSAEPALCDGLREMRDRLLDSPDAAAFVRRQFSMKEHDGLRAQLSARLRRPREDPRAPGDRLGRDARLRRRGAVPHRRDPPADRHRTARVRYSRRCDGRAPLLVSSRRGSRPSN